MSLNQFNLETGSGTTIVYLHGWGMDSRIFESFETKCPVLSCEIGHPNTLVDDLADLVEKRQLGPLHLIGFSMGACLSVAFAKQYPHLVNSLTLIALGTRYDKPVIDDIRGHIKHNVSAYLRSFYKGCFTDPQAFRTFYSSVGKEMASSVSLEALDYGLNYLESVSISSSDLPETRPIHLFHGDKDIIAPAANISTLSLKQNSHVQILPDCGHFILDHAAIKQHLTTLG